MSCYSIINNFSFIHIPKNAGVAIRNTLAGQVKDLMNFDRIDELVRDERDPALANHFPVYKIQQLLRKAEIDIPFDGMRKFMVVRNPWERMVSLYHHRMRKLHYDYKGKPRNTPEDIRVAEEGFVSWLLRTPSAGDSVLTKMAQVRWGEDLDGRYVVRAVKMENLALEWESICEWIGIPQATLLKMNVGTGEAKSYHEHYTQEAIDHVSHWFADDIRRYGYVF